MARSWFTEAEIQKVEARVAEVERTTRGEIVPLVVASSDSYWGAHGFMAFGFALAGVLGVEWVRSEGPWSMPAWEAVGAVALMGLLGAVLPLLGPIKRGLVPSARRSRRVRERALLDFLLLGLQETRDRTGVLIYLSLLEQQVEILADRGIHAEVPAGFWAKEAAALTGAIRSGRPGEGLEQVVSQIGARLAERFPVREGDRNEVSDKVLFGHPPLPTWKA